MTDNLWNDEQRRENEQASAALAEQLRALLPCPFCGSAGKIIGVMGKWISENGYGPDGARIVCSGSECSGCGSVFHGPNQEADAIAAWNKRSTDRRGVEADGWNEAVEACAEKCEADAKMYWEVGGSALHAGLTNAAHAIRALKRRATEEESR